MTSQFLRSQFGDSCVQLCSGDSVVLMCTDQQVVYKYPLSAEARDRLKSLVLDSARLQNVEHIAIPKQNLRFGMYFEYDAYRSPLLPDEAKPHISAVVSKIVDAISALHREQIAHLDTRLENICWSSDGNAVLIDLDRSIDTSNAEVSRRKAQALYVKYSRSEMYRVENRSWTCTNLDWKQLGKLIVGIEESSSEDTFVKKLINECEFLKI